MRQPRYLGCYGGGGLQAGSLRYFFGASASRRSTDGDREMASPRHFLSERLQASGLRGDAGFGMGSRIGSARHAMGRVEARALRDGVVVAVIWSGARAGV